MDDKRAEDVKVGWIIKREKRNKSRQYFEQNTDLIIIVSKTFGEGNLMKILGLQSNGILWRIYLYS